MPVASEAVVLRAERRSLYTYMFTMLGLAVLGFVVYGVTRVSATQLDGVISLINAAAASIAARLAVTASRPADVESPYGRLALENLYALFRSLMISASWSSAPSPTRQGDRVPDHPARQNRDFGPRPSTPVVCVLICLN